MRSAINAFRLAAKIIHHPSSQPLETQLQCTPTESSGVVEIQRKRDLAAGVTKGNEIPDPVEAAKRAINQIHAQAPGWIDRVACGGALVEPGELEIKPRHKQLVLAFPKFGTGPPGEGLLVSVNLTDQT